MGFLFSARGLGDTQNELVPMRARNQIGMIAPGDEMRVSAVWASLRLRANLISSLPYNPFRKTAGIQQQIVAPRMLVSPGSLFVGGPAARIDEWVYATQMDLDRYGNAFGLIVERDSLMRPSRIDLVPAEKVTVRVKDHVLTYRFSGKVVDTFDVWHEKQYVVAGLPVGLSPVGYAALTLGQYASAQEFARQWFSLTPIPSAKLKNTKRKLTQEQTAKAKAQVKATLSAGDVLVLDDEWEYEMNAVPSAQSEFLNAMSATDSQIARFFDVPGDLIEAAVSGQSITYANLTQRNLQLLIMHLGPAILRREAAFSLWLPQPQFVRADTNSLLRMDPATLTTMLAEKVKARALTPSEWRTEVDNKPPLTQEQIDEFAALFPLQSDAKKETL